MPDSTGHLEGPDTLIWRMAADALSLAVRTTQGLVRASSVHPEAEPVAQHRIDTLVEFATILGTATRDMQDRLDGVGPIGEFDRIVDRFWTEPDATDLDEAA
jgi:hypothetical protein